MPLSPCPHIKQSYSYFPTYLVVQVEFFFSFSPWFLVLELLTAMYIFPALPPPPPPPPVFVVVVFIAVNSVRRILFAAGYPCSCRLHRFGFMPRAVYYRVSRGLQRIAFTLHWSQRAVMHC